MLSKYDSLDFETLEYKVLCDEVPVIYWGVAEQWAMSEVSGAGLSSLLSLESFGNLNKH